MLPAFNVVLSLPKFALSSDAWIQLWASLQSLLETLSLFNTLQNYLPLVVFRLLLLTVPRLPELGMPSTAPKPVVMMSVFSKLRPSAAAATSEKAR